MRVDSSEDKFTLDCMSARMFSPAGNMGMSPRDVGGTERPLKSGRPILGGGGGIAILISIPLAPATVEDENKS